MWQASLNCAQLVAVPPVQKPAKQRSPVVQNWPSSQGLPAFSSRAQNSTGSGSPPVPLVPAPPLPAPPLPAPPLPAPPLPPLPAMPAPAWPPVPPRPAVLALPASALAPLAPPAPSLALPPRPAPRLALPPVLIPAPRGWPELPLVPSRLSSGLSTALWRGASGALSKEHARPSHTTAASQRLRPMSLPIPLDYDMPAAAYHGVE